jgi:hypothetical protein
MVPIWESIDPGASTGTQMGTIPIVPGHRHRVSLTRCRCASALRPWSSTAPAPHDWTSGPGPRSSTAPAPDWPLICPLPIAGTVVPVPCGYRGRGQMRGQSGQGTLRPLTPTAPDTALCAPLRPSGPPALTHAPAPALRPRTAPYGPVRPRPWCIGIDGPGPIDGPGASTAPAPALTCPGDNDNNQSHDNPTKER